MDLTQKMIELQIKRNAVKKKIEEQKKIIQELKGELASVSLKIIFYF
ncbi:MAG: hypothetical protein MJ252_27710 [archaeon]|nr:hypothetical protein [archaeon]